jgi:methionyl aminopeptidase
MARLKTARDLVGIYRSSQIAGRLLDAIGAEIKPGVTTKELDTYCAQFIRGNGGVPSFLNYNGYPGNVCISVNQEIVHGIPKDQVLNEGDKVTIDVGVKLDGFFTDTARTFYVGADAPPADLARLLKGTAESLQAGIGALAVGQPLRLASRAIEQTLLKHHLAVIQELTGHGVGWAVHEEPTVYNFDPGTRRPLVENGMVLAIEPMAALGGPGILLAADNWTYYTADGSLAAHYEHTVALWDNRAFVLTDTGDDAARQAFGGAG